MRSLAVLWMLASGCSGAAVAPSIVAQRAEAAGPSEPPVSTTTTELPEPLAPPEEAPAALVPHPCIVLSAGAHAREHGAGRGRVKPRGA